MFSKEILQGIVTRFPTEVKNPKGLRRVVGQPLDEFNLRGRLGIKVEFLELTEARLWGGRWKSGWSATDLQCPDRGPDLQKLHERCRVIRPIVKMQRLDPRCLFAKNIQGLVIE